MPLRSPESAFYLIYLNLSLGMAFAYGCHGGDFQVTVTVFQINVGAHVYYAGCDGGSYITACDNSQRADGLLGSQ